MIHPYVLTFLLSAIAGMLGLFVLTPDITALDIALRSYQVSLTVNGNDPSLLYQMNAPYGAITDAPFSAGGGLTLNAIAALLGTATTLYLLPFLAAGLLGGSLGLLALHTLRMKEDMLGMGGVMVAITAGALGTFTGLFFTLDTSLSGLGLLASGSTLLALFFFFHPKGPLPLATILLVFALWIIPQAWPLIVAIGLGASLTLYRLPRRASAMPSFFLGALLIAGLTLTGYTGATTPWDTTALSLFHAGLFAGIAGFTMLTGFLPTKHLYGTSVLLAALGLTPLVMDSAIANGLAGILVAGMGLWLWTMFQTFTKGLKGRDFFLLPAGAGLLIAFILATPAPLSENAPIAGWLAIAIALIGTMKAVSHLGFHTASGGGAIMVSALPILLGLGGAATGALSTPTTSVIAQSDPFPQCRTQDLDKVYLDWEDLGIRRIMASSQNGAHFLDNPNLSIVGLHPSLEGWETTQTVLEDTYPFETARRALFKRSIDTIIVCGDHGQPQSLHDSLQNGTGPSWAQPILLEDSISVFRIDRDATPEEQQDPQP